MGDNAQTIRSSDLKRVYELLVVVALVGLIFGFSSLGSSHLPPSSLWATVPRRCVLMRSVLSVIAFCLLSASASAEPFAFKDIPVSVGPPASSLGGTLTLPTALGSLPAVILVQGSGPSDRDETIGPNKPFKDLAEGLAAHGIAVLRYDKRTFVYPNDFRSLKAPTVRDEIIDDVLAAINLIAERPDIDQKRIVLLGHSLGGTLAPRIARETDKVRAIVILSGATEPLPVLLLKQVIYLAKLQGLQTPDFDPKITALKQAVAKALAAKPGDIGDPILGVPPSYWGDLNAYDPAKTAADLSIPILVMRGERDYQVTADDMKGFRKLLADHRNIRMQEFPKLDHFFMVGRGPGTPANYTRPGHVDPGAIDAIALFISTL